MPFISSNDRNKRKKKTSLLFFMQLINRLALAALFSSASWQEEKLPAVYWSAIFVLFSHDDHSKIKQKKNQTKNRKRKKGSDRCKRVNEWK